MKKIAIVLLSFLALPVMAGDIGWNGVYRAEGVKIKGAELDSQNSDKSYLLHHLVLQPKVIAADGITIFGRFDIFNNSSFGQDNQRGEFLGSGPRRSNPRTGTTNADDSNTMSSNQASGLLAVTQLNVTWVHEFGVLTFGRTPVHFGLGTAINSGQGLFDHYIDTRDLVAYKFIMGNLLIIPSMAKISEGDLGDEDDVDEYTIHTQYDNPETDLSVGAMFQFRNSTKTGNDTPKNVTGTGQQDSQGYRTRLVGLFFNQKVSDFNIGFEADLLSGTTGLVTAASREIGIEAFSLNTDVRYRAQGSSSFWGLKAGIVSGDDPGTEDTFEGFFVHRNYEVAMLMFNHPLGNGNVDFLRTQYRRSRALTASQYPDTEALSNAFYIAPSYTQQVSDKHSWGASFIYAMLNKDPIANGNTAKDLGYEIDLNWTFKPIERLSWVNEFGLLVPGDAWRGGSRQYENRIAYGLISKAAISF